MHQVCKKTRSLMDQKTKAAKILAVKKYHKSALALQHINRQISSHLNDLASDLMVVSGGRA